MGMCGGSPGYQSTGSTNTSPWSGQSKYLLPLFKSTFAGAYGGAPTWDDKTGELEMRDVEFSDQIYKRFKGTDEWGTDLPGKLQYFGDIQKMWRDTDTLEGSRKGLEYGYSPSTTGLQMTAAPTVAGFSPEELAVQNIIKNRLKGETSYQDYNTGYDTLIPTATTALQNVISGVNRINPASFSGANVASPSAINSPNISAPGGYSTPNIENTNLDYRFWNPLGSMAGGNENNAYLEDMISNAKENLWKDYRNYGVPGTDTTAEAAGRYGGNTWKELRGDLYDKTSKNAGQIETSMRGEAYNQDMNRALQAMNLGGTLAESQAGLSANKALNQAQLEAQNKSQRYSTEADINKLMGQLGLQASTEQAGNELTRNVQNALLSQEAAREGAGYTQQANVQNIANILSGAPVAPAVSQADYEDIAKLAAVGEAQSTKQQDIIDAFMARQQFKQLEPYQRSSLMSNLLSGDFGSNVISTARAPSSSGGCF